MYSSVMVRTYDQLVRHVVVPAFAEIIDMMAFTGMNAIGEADNFTTDLTSVTI